MIARARLLVFSTAVAVGCGSEPAETGNPFERRFFKPLPAGIDCTELEFSARTPGPECLFADPPTMGTTTDLPDGTYHLSSFRGRCDSQWIDAMMTVETLPGGMRLVKERRPSTAPSVPGTVLTMLSNTYVIDPAVHPGELVQVACLTNNIVWPPLDAKTMFTVIDSYTTNGKTTVAIKIEDFYILVYTQD